MNQPFMTTIACPYVVVAPPRDKTLINIVAITEIAAREAMVQLG
ncbi:hypothetical protein [Vibrio sp. Hep-1b-8]|nr:hypothetical protein [Vibrio sp. Hep-1b-8]